MIQILFAVLVMAILGLVLGLVISLAGKAFYVRTDERVDRVRELLPGANCGACGYPSCNEYARNVVKKGEKTNRCTVGGYKTAARIAKIMGSAPDKTRRMRAQVMCCGTNRLASKKYNYEGLRDCLSVAKLGNGPKDCSDGCIGLGTCVKTCPFGAIKLENGVAAVQHEKCRGCGACASICPQNIINLIPYDADIWVGCSSHGRGASVRNICKVGCTSCGECVNVCPSGAISIRDDLAVIDYGKCINCGACVSKCPRGIIRSGMDQLTKGTFITSTPAPDDGEQPKPRQERLFTEDYIEFGTATTSPGSELEVTEDDNKTQA